MHVCLLSHVRLFVTLWTVAHQAPLSMGFPRQEYGSRLPFPSLGDPPNPGTELASPVFPALAGGFFTAERPGTPPCGRHHFYTSFSGLISFLCPPSTAPQNTFFQNLVSRSGPVRNQKKPGAAMLGLCEVLAQNPERIGHSVSANAPILWMKTSGGRDQPAGRRYLQDGN